MHGVVNVIFVRPCSVLLQEAATTKLCRSFGRREWLLKKQQAFVEESDDAMTEMFTRRPTVHTSSTSPSAASSAAIKKMNE